MPGCVEVPEAANDQRDRTNVVAIDLAEAHVHKLDFEPAAEVVVRRDGARLQVTASAKATSRRSKGSCKRPVARGPFPCLRGHCGLEISSMRYRRDLGGKSSGVRR